MPHQLPHRRGAAGQSRATMQDVAALAGVSLKSVSRVVNGEPGVSSQLAQRVELAVQRLGYRHNLVASSLRSGRRTASIGVVVQDLSNGFCSEILRAVEDAARTRGFVVMAASTDEDRAREQELVHGLVSRRIDGLILMSTGLDLTWLAHDIAAGLPVVAVDRTPVVAPTDAVVIDNQGAAAEAVGHLVAHGHRRIAFLGDTTTIPTAQDRLLGYRAALRAARLTPEPELERSGLRSMEAARAAVHDLLGQADPPTALFAARNTVNEGVLIALQELDRSASVALVGFDDFPAALLVRPRVTVMRQDTYAIGARAIERLLARVEGDDSTPRTVVVPTELVARGSGEIEGPYADEGSGRGAG